MNQIVPVSPNHAEALREHEDVADDFLEREAGADIANSQRPDNAVDPAVGNLDVFTFVKGQEIQFMSAFAEKLQHSSDRERGSSGLEERMGC
jgi:hypothetical protein